MLQAFVRGDRSEVSLTGRPCHKPCSLYRITDASSTDLSGTQGVLNPLAWGSYTYVLLLVMLTLITWLRCCLLSFSTVKLLYFPLVTNKYLSNTFGNILFYLKLHLQILASIDGSCLQQLLLCYSNNYHLFPLFLLIL